MLDPPPEVGQAGLRSYQMEASLDYAATEWYREGLAAEGWSEPHLSRTTNTLVAGYHVHFRRPGAPGTQPQGMVRIDLSMDGIRKIVSSLSLGRTGYGFLNSPKGVYLAHPREDLVTRQKLLSEEAEELDEASRLRLAELARTGARGHVETISSLANLPVMVFTEPIPTPPPITPCPWWIAKACTST